jgi:hypothetical protein
MSFDFCSMGPDAPTSFTCIFNDRSVSVDDSLIDETSSGSACDHFAKVSKGFDSLDVEAVFGLIEKVALRNGDEPLVLKTNKNKEIVFPEINIFRTNEFEGFNSDVSQQVTSFSRQFYLSGKFDFNQTTMELGGQSVFKQRVGVSVDECARLCVEEQEFECFTFSYSSVFKYCKWTSLNAYGKEVDKVFYANSKVDLFRSKLIFFV